MIAPRAQFNDAIVKLSFSEPVEVAKGDGGKLDVNVVFCCWLVFNIFHRIVCSVSVCDVSVHQP